MGAGNWTAHSLTTEPSHKHNFYEHLNQVAAVFTSMTNNWETQPQFFIKENDLFFSIQSLLKTAFPIPRSTWTWGILVPVQGSMSMTLSKQKVAHGDKYGYTM